MQVIKNPDRKEWGQLLQRPQINHASLEYTVNNVLQEVKKSGDEAVRRFSLMYDKIALDQMEAGADEFIAAEKELSNELKEAIQLAKKNITIVHAAQVENPARIETTPGVTCWRKSVAIEKAGLYIPGGSAPLFSTILMLGIPAKIAGCKEIIL